MIYLIIFLIGGIFLRYIFPIFDFFMEFLAQNVNKWNTKIQEKTQVIQNNINKMIEEIESKKTKNEEVSEHTFAIGFRTEDCNSDDAEEDEKKG
jgi:ABC-type multidrug transport system fused ATPase/permease subunit